MIKSGFRLKIAKLPACESVDATDGAKVPLISLPLGPRVLGFQKIASRTPIILPGEFADVRQTAQSSLATRGIVVIGRKGLLESASGEPPLASGIECYETFLQF